MGWFCRSTINPYWATIHRLSINMIPRNEELDFTSGAARYKAFALPLRPSVLDHHYQMVLFEESLLRVPEWWVIL
jgi:hypothetical protein